MSRRAELAATISSIRGHTARGVMLNSAYSVVLSALGLVQRLVAAAFMARAEFGLWAIILTLVASLSWLKNIGVMDKYLQQSERDQELAFQRAFTLELIVSLVVFAFIALVLPLWALAYGHQEIILGGILTALVLPLGAFSSPTWIPYRRLQYGRQRLLTGVPVVVGFVVTVALAIAGTGYWAFVVGVLVGSIVGGVVCVATSPYRLRWRYDAAIARGYVSFSWPLVAASLAGLVLIQGSLLIVDRTLGLAAVGTVGLVIGIVTFAERIDAIISQTIYPAICAVTDRRDLLEEILLKSNRVALMWAVPFAVGLALFAGDLVTFVLGERWRATEPLLIVVGLSVGLGQVAFNWILFFRALNRTRPIFVATGVNTVVFLGVLIPAISAFGLTGYGVAFAISAGVQVVLRSFFLRQLFGGYAGAVQLARAVAPVVPGAAVILLERAAVGQAEVVARAFAELAVFIAVTVTATFILERRLVIEMLGYARRGGRSKTPPLTVPEPVDTVLDTMSATVPADR